MAAEDSAPFKFPHVFTRDNKGKLADFYELGSRLGDGAFGSVFKGKCKRVNADRAIKAIELKAVKDMAAFERETSIQMMLDHPNIVRLYETFRDAKKVYLVMELCTGGEFFDKIVEEGAKGFDESKVACYVNQMLAAICYCHANKICHRDIKPENFLMQSNLPDAKLKLIDFGLSTQFEPGKPLTTKSGTAFYVAPEVMNGKYDEKCDIWSIGVMAFILFCGYPPFNADNDPEIIRKVKEGKVVFLSPHWDKVSDAARSLVLQMFTKKPSDRPSAEILLQNSWLHATSDREATGPICTDFSGRLKSFQANSRFKKVALTALAQQLKDEDVEALQNTFRALDQNQNGMLAPQEIRAGMLKLGLKVPDNLEETLRNVDSDGSGELDYSEFLAATIDKQLYMQRDVCWAAFRTFDLDGDGKITQDELSQVLNADGVQSSLGAESIKRMIAEVDQDGDGCIDFEEFCAMMKPANKRRRTKGPECS